MSFSAFSRLAGSRLAVVSLRILCCLSLLAVLCPRAAQAQTDTPPPSVAVTSPSNGSRQSSLSSFPSISGTASDDVGVTSVNLRLVRIWATGNWSGTAWSGNNTPISLSTTLTGTGTGGATTTATWTCSATLPSGTNLVAGQYNIQVSAFDAAGHQTNNNTCYVTLGSDSTAPTGTITSPTANALYAPADALTYGGTVQEESGGSGLWRVYGTLARTHNGALQYWNGTSWATSGYFFTSSTLSAPNSSGVVTWSANVSQPPAAQRENGMETFYAILQDQSGNARTISIKYYVTPEDHVAPSVTLVGPSANEHLSSTGLSSASATNGLGLSDLLKGQTWDDSSGSGIYQTQAVLTRSWSGVVEYWNGTAWFNQQHHLHPSLDPLRCRGRQ